MEPLITISFWKQEVDVAEEAAGADVVEDSECN